MGFLDQCISVTAQETLYTTKLVNVFYSHDRIQLVELNSVCIFYAIQGTSWHGFALQRLFLKESTLYNSLWKIVH
jgi:hypothetical protein